MISVALFPCLFTDGARIVGELANALQVSVNTDAMIVQEIADRSGITVRKIQSNLLGRPEATGRLGFEKEKTVNLIKDALAGMLLSSKDSIYYGMFSSLLVSEDIGTLRVLVDADDTCRLQRAVRQEGLSERAARKLMRKHDEKAAAWTRFLHDKPFTDVLLYDSVISYGCQDLLDVAAYIFMMYEERLSVTRRDDVKVAARNMKLAAGVENVLLEKGLRAKVKVCADKVDICVAASLHCFSWLTSELTDLMSRIDGLRTFKVREVASAMMKSDRLLKICYTAEPGGAALRPVYT